MAYPTLADRSGATPLVALPSPNPRVSILVMPENSAVERVQTLQVIALVRESPEG